MGKLLEAPRQIRRCAGEGLALQFNSVVQSNYPGAEVNLGMSDGGEPEAMFSEKVEF
jgi:hypothetical protein